MTNGNGYTQKELLNMVIERLDKIEDKLDAKLDKAEFYKVLTLFVAIGGVVAEIVLYNNHAKNVYVCNVFFVLASISAERAGNR